MRCVWLLEDCGTTSLGTGRVALDTVPSATCHRHTDHCRLPVAMPGDRQRQRMLKFLARRICTHFLAMAWQHAPCLICVPAYRIRGFCAVCAQGQALCQPTT